MSSTTTQLRRVALQNKSSKSIGFDDLAKLAPALQTQVDRDFFPSWGVRAQVFPLHQVDPIPNGVWPIFFIDPKDEPGGQGLGVHLDKNHKPFAFVTDSDQYTITASHELLEMLADPFGTRFMQGPDIDPDSDRHLVSYLVEVGDPCEVFPYSIDNIAVSDFVTADYYHAEIENGVYDFLRQLSNPLEVPRGCYISWQDNEDRHWHQKRPDGSFVTARSTIHSTKNPRDDRDSTFGKDEENERIRIRIIKDTSGKQVFSASQLAGQSGKPLHTAEGIVTIPYTFQGPGDYSVSVPVYGILFNPIRPESADFTIKVM